MTAADPIVETEEDLRLEDHLGVVAEVAHRPGVRRAAAVVRPHVAPLVMGRDRLEVIVQKEILIQLLQLCCHRSNA